MYCHEYKTSKGARLIFNVGLPSSSEMRLRSPRVEIFEKIGLNDVAIWFAENRTSRKDRGPIAKPIFPLPKLIQFGVEEVTSKKLLTWEFEA